MASLTHCSLPLERLSFRLLLLGFATMALLGRSIADDKSDSSNLIVNGGFENGMEAWEWFLGHDGNAQATIDTSEKHSGAASLLITSNIQHAPNVFGALRYTVNLKPHTQYILSLWVKGDNASQNSLAFGAHWDQRKALPEGTYDWQLVTKKFDTGSEGDRFSIVILTDGSTKSLWVDDITLTEANAVPKQAQIFEPSSWTGLAASARFYPVLAGEIQDVAPLLHIQSGDNPPLVANIQMARDNDHFFF
jgi:hypothetical protein